MNRQLIEKIAMEVAEGIQYEDSSASLFDTVPASGVVALCTKFLSRIDAERGKDAVAWESDTFVTLNPDKAARWMANGYEVRPLFLSPTIPPGMVLFSLETLAELIRDWREGTDGRGEKVGYNRGVDFAFCQAAMEL